MARTDVSMTSEFYHCYPLSRMDGRDERDIRAFEPVDPRGMGLVAYLQRQALSDELRGTMRTYLVRDNLTDELVGYFSLKAGLVSVNESGDAGGIEFDTVPGVELANFAVDGRFRRAHPEARGCCKAIFSDLVLPVVGQAAEVVGVAVLYIFSLPEERVMSNYEGYGFHRLGEEAERSLHSRLKLRYDQQCVFMYMML